LIGVDRKWLVDGQNDAIDPEQTLPSSMQGIRVVAMTRTRCGYACGAR
jgi:hypothetical protein